MYYSSGNYEAFAHPRKPKDVEKKSAHLIGSGLASLAAACFLVRDGQMPEIGRASCRERVLRLV